MKLPIATSRPCRLVLLVGLGIFSLVPYLWAFRLQDLREHTVDFEYVFLAAFALYAVAVAVILRSRPAASPELLAVALSFAVIYRAILIFTPPTLSDDMYRYVWDGRVQANQISPYAYSPDAPEVTHLRDDAVWPNINRKGAVTVYPAGAELAYAAIWRLVPDDVRWVQIVMASGGLLAGILLISLLRHLGRPPELALIYLWNPLVIVETAHSAHMDGLVLPLLVAAWLATVKGRDTLAGAVLGAATALKLYPALLFPVLWRPQSRGWPAALRMPLALLLAFALPYLPYVALGATIAGYLPRYLNEERSNNIGLPQLISPLVERMWGQPYLALNLLLLVLLAAVSLFLVLRPLRSRGDRAGRPNEETLRRCIWPVGIFLLFTPNLYPWYVLWLVPLLVLYLRPGPLGLRLDAWTGWFLFTGLVALHYTYFIRWEEIGWTVYAEFIPLYILLVLPFLAQGAVFRSVRQVYRKGFRVGRNEPSAARDR